MKKILFYKCDIFENNVEIKYPCVKCENTEEIMKSLSDKKLNFVIFPNGINEVTSLVSNFYKNNIDKNIIFIQISHDDIEYYDNGVTLITEELIPLLIKTFS